MTLTFAAVGAVMAAILDLTLWPYLTVAGGHPHLVLIYVVVLAAAIGLDSGITGAFVGGLALDFLAPRPLGSSAFALLVCAGVGVVLGRLLVQVRYLAPVAAVFILSFVYSMLVAILNSALATPLGLSDPAGVLLPGALYDTILAALIGPLAVALKVRRLEQERVDW